MSSQWILELRPVVYIVIPSFTRDIRHQVIYLQPLDRSLQCILELSSAVQMLRSNFTGDFWHELTHEFLMGFRSKASGWNL